MKPRPNIADKAQTALARAACPNPEPVLRANGAAITADSRDEMLARCAAGQYVELELDVMAFEQKPGVQNRNYVRFRDGAMLALGRSGVGTPFMRDHDQDDAMARGGTIVASQAEKRGDGDYAIRQTVKLTAPWAVDLALRGLLSTVSIGWNPTGAVQCSVCSLNFYRCSHYPGERYSMREMDDGSRRPVADAAGPMVCERIYTSAELVETSAVSVPAVPSAQIDAIRAALSAQKNTGMSPGESEIMNPKLLALLGLTATAGEIEVEKAVESILSAKKLGEQQRDELATQLATANAKITGYEQVLEKQAEDEFVTKAIQSGKLIPGSQHEQSLRAFYTINQDAARAFVASSPAVTPVGAPRQAGGPVPADPKGTATDQTIATVGGDPNKVRANLLASGFSPDKVEKMLADAVGGKAR